MKRFVVISAFISGALTISCCTKSAKEVQNSVNINESTTIVMQIPPAEFEQEELPTRMDASWGSSTDFLWAETDTVAIFPTNGCQIYFSAASGAGTTKITFDGGGWALIRDAEYYSYFPFIPDYYIKKNLIPISFAGQVQKGNSNPNIATLGRNCPMLAKGVYQPESNTLNFDYKRLGTLLRFRIPVDAGSYEKFEIVTDENVIAYEGTFSPISEKQVISNAKFTNSLSLKLEDVNFEEPGTLVVFISIPPFDILNKQLSLRITKSDGTIMHASGFGRTYETTKTIGYNPKFTAYAKNANIDGNGGTAQVVITASGTNPYSVSTDVDWLTLGSNPTSGSVVINVTAGKGTAKERTGHVIVSEDVTYNGTTITLQNKVKITQDIVGMSVNVGDWEDDGIDYGGVAL